MSSQRVKKELYETAMTGEKALTSLMYVQMTLYAAKETHLPEELQSKAETFLVQTVHALDVTEKKQMYRRELIGMEEKVKETAEQIEELLKSMRELGV